ncbi:MAG: hypothetical protein M3163_02820 [Actinomycetota bacterium]|nr:hypothetical protein [Actinomycetota bacterium]
MRRHWLLVLVAILLTAPIARSIGGEVDPVYEAKGTLLLLSPARTYSAEGQSIEVNPFSRSGNAERVAAGAVLTVSHTTRWKDRMIAAGARGKYEYRLVSEVVMEVTVTDKTADGALNTLAVAIRLLENELAQRQQRAGAPRETWIYVDILAVPEEATVLLGSRIRATAGVAVLGMAVAATLAFVAEALGIGGGRRRRRLRRRRPPEDAASQSRVRGDGGVKAAVADVGKTGGFDPGGQHVEVPVAVPATVDDAATRLVRGTPRRTAGDGAASCQ